MRLIRVFPRRTSATPTDCLAIVGRGPDLFDEADEVHISVSFSWDIPAAEKLAKKWAGVGHLKVGGPAYNDPGDEFVPGRYIKTGYVITTRGCPNNCWFCEAWRNEGRMIRELEIKPGWNLLDNNILASSREHQKKVYEMLTRQSRKPRFTGGLDAALLTPWNCVWLVKLKPDYIYFAYDTPDDYVPLKNAADLLRQFELLKHHKVGCYVLVGFPGDTICAAERRLKQTISLGYFPQAMLYNRGYGWDKEVSQVWRRFARSWANKTIVGARMKTLDNIP